MKQLRAKRRGSLPAGLRDGRSRVPGPHVWVRVETGAEPVAREIPAGELSIGSGPEADLRLDDEAVAPLHATIRRSPDGEVVLHAEDDPGAFVDGRRVEGPVALSGDETIRVGESLLVLSLEEPGAEVAEDPDEVLAALAEGDVPPSPARRRRFGRAALEGLRSARRTARIGIGLAALALLAAVALGIAALSGEEDGGGTSAPDAESIAAAGRPATVFVRARGLGQESFGSGVVVDADEGLVLTNFHVVGLGEDVQAGRPDDLDDATVLAAAPCDDLALLEVEGLDGVEPLVLGSQDDIAQGDQVVALGYPASASGGVSLTSTAGVVSAVRTSLRKPTPDAPRFDNLVQTDAPLNPGNSGGPLVGEDGKLIGVSTILFRGTQAAPVTDQGYAVGVDRIRTVLEELREGRSIGWFGAGLLVPPASLLERERLPDGLVAASATEGTSAEAIGLEDVLITEIGGRPVGRTLSSYCEAVAGVKSGDARSMKLIAGPRRVERTVRVVFE
jgi:putative serine protease PepD